MEERGQDIVYNLICNVSMNIHSLQLTLVFILVTQSTDWLKETPFSGLDGVAPLSIFLTVCG